jgi:hypothetical protein
MILQTSLDKLLEGDVFGFALDVFGGAAPEPVLALLVFGTVGVGYYMTQRSVAIPLVMVTLIGGVTITEFPLPFQQGIIATFVIAIAGVGYILLQRVKV